MKKSTRLLLGGLLTVLLVLAALHISLYAKYKAGDMVAYDRDAWRGAKTTQQFGAINQLELRNLGYITVRFSDTARLDRFDEEKGTLKVRQQGTQLFLASADSLSQNRTYTVVYVPVGTTIQAYNTLLFVEGSTTKVLPQLTIRADSSEVRFQETSQRQQIDSLHIAATRGSEISLENIQVRRLRVQLQKSAFRDENALIDSLQLVADEASHLALQSRTILRITPAKTTTYE